MTELWRMSLAGVLLMGGCYRGNGLNNGGADATAGDTDTDGDADGSDPAADGVDGACEGVHGSPPLRRLTNFEYDNTVADLLGVDIGPSSGFVPDDAAEGYASHAAAAPISQLQSERYLEAAEVVAEAAIADVASIVACDPTADPVECGAQFVDDFGPRAFRRPLAEAEHADLIAVFDEGLASFGFDEAIGLVITTALVSPSFLYRPELGEAGAIDEPVALTPYELASRLSYFVWGSMPDDELFEAAAQEQLATVEDIEAQARRMLDDPRARRAVTEFHAQWLHLHKLEHVTKDTMTYPSWSDDIRDPLQAETRTFLEHVVFEDGDLRQLLTADYTFVDGELADFYGLDPVAAAGLVRVDLDPARTAGVLTHGSLLATYGKPAQSDPVRRGAFVRDRLLCQPLPDPPPDVDTTLPDIEEGVSNRERLSRHSEDPTCAGCHQLIDPVGFGFEHYDGTGRWRSTDNGLPIDASGELIGVQDEIGPFDGVDELGERLARSNDFTDCFVRQWFRFAYARAEAEGDACTLEALHDALTAADYDVREFIVAFVGSRAFRTRPGYEPVGE